MVELIGSILVLVGAFFLFSAGLGLLRMPDAYTRIQAGTKASTLGNILVLAGLGFYHPDWALKLLVVAYFVLMTNPLSSHALSRAAHAIRTPMAPSTMVDALRDEEAAGGKSPDEARFHLAGDSDVRCHLWRPGHRLQRTPDPVPACPALSDASSAGPRRAERRHRHPDNVPRLRYAG